MGGVCKLHGSDGSKDAPACTDNFQVLESKFEYAGANWWSAEQAYQAAKFEIGSKPHSDIFLLDPGPNQSDWDYGMDAWRLGQVSQPVKDWGDVKLKTMLAVNAAKFLSSEALRTELIATGDSGITGATSTWNWQEYNGKIMQFIRSRINGGGLELVPELIEGMTHRQICSLIAK